ncbi:MAG: glycosyltransferase [Verrucomicrobiota bacterium]|jgi:glycosyltransferase involved in cell wall biosynthesis
MKIREEHLAVTLPEVIIVTDSYFPNGSADANNLQGHCHAIKTAGFTVGLLPRKAAGQSAPRNGEGACSFRGHPYWLVHDPTRLPKIRRLLRGYFGIGDQRIAWLRRQGLTGVKAVIALPGSGGTVGLLWWLRRLCKNFRVPLYNIVLEWIAPQHRPEGVFSATLDSEIQRRYMNHRLDGTICITESLQAYYKRAGARCIVVPPLLDLSDPKWKTPAGSPPPEPKKLLRLLFSGGPERDRQDIVLRAVKRLREKGVSIELEYLGADRSKVEALPNVGSELIDSLGSAVRFHGRVADDQVLKIAASASFGIILRDQAHWSRSLFPSKVPEFLALKVPMICNYTSDLHKFLKDGHNAMIVDGTPVEALCVALERASSLSAEKFLAMKANAATSAREFDGEKYAASYRQLFGAS